MTYVCQGESAEEPRRKTGKYTYKDTATDTTISRLARRLVKLSCEVIQYYQSRIKALHSGTGCMKPHFKVRHYLFATTMVNIERRANLVVLGVMNLHDLATDMRFKGAIVVGQVG